MSRGDEDECRVMVKVFVAWCKRKHLDLSMQKTKELVEGLGRDEAPVAPVSLRVVSVDTAGLQKSVSAH